MISQNIILALQNATSRAAFNEIVAQNNLETRESTVKPVVFAYVKGAYKDRISSPCFCNRCGTASNLPDTAEQDGEVTYCLTCADVLEQAKHSSSSTRERGVFADPWLNATHIPDHVIAGEIHEDRMAMFRNEY